MAFDADQMWVPLLVFETVSVPDTEKLSVNEVVCEALSKPDVSVRLLKVFPAVVTAGVILVCVSVTVYVLGVNVIPDISVSAPYTFRLLEKERVGLFVAAVQSILRQDAETSIRTV